MGQVRDDSAIFPPSLKWNFEEFVRFEAAYERSSDVFYLSSEPRRPAVSMDVGGHLWVRFDPTTNEVVGIEIEDFEKVFLVQYPELAVGWKETRPAITKRRKSTHNDLIGEYLGVLYRWLKEVVSTHPQQIALKPA